MAAPYIQFAYVGYDNRFRIYVVVHVEPSLLPLKVLALGQAQDGWFLKRNGVPYVSFSVLVAEPRPNVIEFQLNDAWLTTDTWEIYYDNGPGDIADQGNQELTSVLEANAYTVRPPLPVIDLIAHNVKSALGDVTTANGYLRTLAVHADLKQPQDRPVAEGLTQISYDDPAPEDDAPINHEQYTASFHVVTTFKVPTTTTTSLGQGFTEGQIPLSDVGYQYEADIWKALNVDHTRGSLAVDTLPGAPTFAPIEGAGGWGAVSVNFTVRFRTLYGNRFSQ